ncbi:cob(I)yrinic acid a,c-diamide adenosyltransferase [Emcibacter nanhaiensis]|uniref:Corrinoid adenosyltransferase n=1 Tax=Emcibacter nanhaiensis TaxID=1505037 RepID=A0A501PKM4_9PROT|nr:cob(I)yrinic acid a,c-diamide adenosyltransferase [Emcibacter nanhaiensis]TPD60638.1 cob(I)yrinic acid a,c-diamide adenosyltransferase [Emcibacter nanhaiensis]
MTSQDKNEQHRAEMKKQQAAHRKKMAGKEQQKRGLLMVNTGSGKGKTTAAFGTILRALGWSRKVGVVQFIKGKWKTGERLFFKRFEDMVDFRVMGEGFTWDTQDRERDIAAARAAWEVGLDMMRSGDYDLVVLDELNIVLRNDYLPVEEVIKGLLSRHKDCSVFVTGRDAPQELIGVADLVTEMTNVKHPFDAGFQPVRGIDF